MDNIKEADGTSLLDNTFSTYGSGLGDGATHQYNDLPIIVADSGGGRLMTGQQVPRRSRRWLTPVKIAAWWQLKGFRRRMALTYSG